MTLQRFHESLAWLAQVAMFLLLGLLVFPSQLPAVAGRGLLLALFLAIVARPVVVTLCLLPFRYQWREIVCIAWLGLRGAVPIILATVPVLMIGTPHAPARDLIDEFDLVFFVVVVGSFIPGMTVRWLPRLLRLEEALPPEPAASIDITTSEPMREEQRTFFIAPTSPAADRTLSELPLPEDVTIMLIVRGEPPDRPARHHPPRRRRPRVRPLCPPPPRRRRSGFRSCVTSAAPFIAIELRSSPFKPKKDERRTTDRWDPWFQKVHVTGTRGSGW